jgi:hypothetical protein
MLDVAFNTLNIATASLQLLLGKGAMQEANRVVSKTTPVAAEVQTAAQWVRQMISSRRWR